MSGRGWTAGSGLVLALVMIDSGLARQQAPPAPIRVHVPADAVPSEARTPEELTRCVERRRQDFASRGLYALSPEKAPEGAEQERLMGTLIELLAELPPSFLERWQARQEGPARKMIEIPVLLDVLLSVTSQRSLRTALNAAEVSAGRPELSAARFLDLLASADPAAESEEAEPEGDSSEPDRWLSGWRSHLRSVPHVVRAALHEPLLFGDGVDGVDGPDSDPGALTREEFLSRLLLIGENSKEHAAAVLKILEPPHVIRFEAEGQPVEEIPVFVPSLRAGAGRVGFSRIHLQMSRALKQAALRNPGEAAGEAPDSFVKAYANELHERILKELHGSGQAPLTLDNPEDLLLIWQEQAGRLPWPELLDQTERLIQQIASGDSIHPLDDEILELMAKRDTSLLSAEEAERLKLLQRQRRSDLLEVGRGLARLASDVAPPPEALKYLDRLMSIFEEQDDKYTQALIVDRAYYNVFMRAPQEAATLLERGEFDWEGPAPGVLPGNLPARAAIRSLSHTIGDVPGSGQLLYQLGMHASDPWMRQEVMFASHHFTEQQAQELFVTAIDDTLAEDSQLTKQQRHALGGAALTMLHLRSMNDRKPGEPEAEWVRESLLSFFERGLWQAPNQIQNSERTRQWAAGVLTPADRERLKSMNALPDWLDEAGN